MIKYMLSFKFVRASLACCLVLFSLPWVEAAKVTFVQEKPLNATTITTSVTDALYSGNPSAGFVGAVPQQEHVEAVVGAYFDWNNVALKNIYQQGPINLQAVVTYHVYELGVFTAKTLTKDLVLQYGSQGQTATVIDKAYFMIPNAHLVSVNWVITSPNAATIAATSAITCKVSIQMDRYTNMSSSNIGAITTSIALNELTLQWPYLTGADWYEVEWAHVNNYSENATTPKQPADITVPADIFQKNATRVAVPNDKNTYQIPLLYEQGYLLYRVRAVSKVQSSGPQAYVYTYSAWSEDITVPTSLAVFQSKVLVLGHETGKNWISLRTFAEDAKCKTEMSYADGTYRTRQKVTKMNTQNEVILGETAYDHLGRPAVQVLPAPIPQQELKYYDDQNITQDGTPLHWKHFDVDGPSNPCIVAPEKLVTTSGASAYYSPNSFAKNDGMHAYLPDAKGYPYTQTEYTNDNTGRIARQGGVGDQYQLGQGHETQYQYSKPNKEELIRLFGHEVGDDINYKKQVVVDPNGQATVSYFDSQGRVIATALTGKKPANLEAIRVAQPKTFNYNLIGKATPAKPYGINNNLFIDNNSAKLFINNKQAVVEDGTQYALSYGIATIPSFISACSTVTTSPNGGDPQITVTNLSHRCVYDFEFRLADDCNQPKLEKIEKVDGTSYQYTGNATLSRVATHSIDKTLSVNEDQLYAYEQEYLAQDCILKLSDFETEERNYIRVEDCDETCESCEQKLATRYPTVPVAGSLDYIDYLDRKERCNELCNTVGDCEVARNMMMADLSPHGQYGKIDGVGVNKIVDPNDPTNIGAQILTGVVPANPVSTDRLSVYNFSNNVLKKPAYPISGFNTQGNEPDFRNPIRPYLDSDGSESLVMVVKGENGYLPTLLINSEPDLSNILLNCDDPIQKNVCFVRPQDLTLKSFLQVWKDSWGASLLEYHPEYPQYQMCLERTASQNYAKKIISLSYTHAVEQGYINANGTINYNKLANEDPAFKQDSRFYSINSVFADWKKAEFKQKMESNYKGSGKSLGNAAYRTEWCPFADAQSPIMPACASCPGNFEIPVAPASEEAKAQTWLRFQHMYNSQHQEVEDYFNQWAYKYHLADNSCFGNDKDRDYAWRSWHAIVHNWYSYGRNPWNAWGNWWNMWNVYRHVNCGWWKADLFKEKTARFPIASITLANLNGTAGQYCDTDENGIEEDCADKTNALISQVRRRSEFNLIKDCGQCPVEMTLQDFLEELMGKSNEWYTPRLTNPSATTYDLSTCEKSNIKSLTPELLTIFGFNGASQNYQMQNVSITEQNEKATITFNVSNGSITRLVTLVISLKDVSNNYTLTSFGAGRFMELCCLQNIPSSTLAAGVAGQQFSFKVYFKPTTPSNAALYEFLAEGSVQTPGLNLAACAFPDVCETTKDGESLVALVGAMFSQFGIPTGPAFNQADRVAALKAGPTVISSTVFGIDQNSPGELTTAFFQIINPLSSYGFNQNSTVKLEETANNGLKFIFSSLATNINNVITAKPDITVTITPDASNTNAAALGGDWENTLIRFTALRPEYPSTPSGTTSGSLVNVAVPKNPDPSVNKGASKVARCTISATQVPLINCWVKTSIQN